MLQFSVLTLFPKWIEQYCGASILGRAQAAGVMSVKTVNPRSFTTDVHHKVDDAPYGGGAGMVMMCKPILDAYESLLPLPEKTAVLLTSPVGKPFTQEKAKALSEYDHVVILCGHYEGIDARVQALIPQMEPVCVGDFVLTGGELAALCIIDATSRLLPGALGKDASTYEESFVDGLLEYPHYTRPAEFQGLGVPKVLLSGNHAEIERWRRKMALKNTQRYRPDLLENRPLPQQDRELLAELEQDTLPLGH
jgi:tRNA (guanine37-N1)-methyltransferase